MGTPYCGKGEPSQMVRVGHASPACKFNRVAVVGGAAMSVRRARLLRRARPTRCATRACDGERMLAAAQAPSRRTSSASTARAVRQATQVRAGRRHAVAGARPAPRRGPRHADRPPRRRHRRAAQPSCDALRAAAARARRRPVPAAARQRRRAASATRPAPCPTPATAGALRAPRRHAGLDFVGFYAGGPVVRAFADSLGSRHWHHVETFHFDWCLYHAADKAVKTAYAGTHWSDDGVRAPRRRRRAAARRCWRGRRAR